MDEQVSTQQGAVKSSLATRIITPQELYDPLLVLLKGKLRLNDWWVIAGVGFVSLAGLYGWMLVRVFNPLQVLVGSLIAPSWIGIYLFLPTSIAALFNHLWENGVIGSVRAESQEFLSYQAFVDKRACFIRSRWWTIGALLFLSLYWLYRIFFAQDLPASASIWLQFPVIVIYSLIGYAGFLSILWLLCTVVSINQLFHRFIIQIKPLHPDGSGGLGPLNQFFWIATALIVIGICAVIALSPGQKMDLGFIFAGITSYLIAIPALVAAWLALPHHVMLHARNELLQPLAEEYERAIRETMPSTRDETAAVVAGTERLAALQKRYEQIHNSFPTWPIELVQMRRLALVLILPILLSLLPSLLDFFIKR
jgi:hypothetical protein